MGQPSFNDVIRRLVGAAFDAGADAARRSGSDRGKAREDQVAYATSILNGQVAAEVARNAQETA